MRPAPPEDNLNLSWARAWVDELARGGVAAAVVSPGSRSALLALALAEDSRIDTQCWLDERAAAFFALGIARVTRKPVALACTSGTAVANYLPAVIEASHSRIPLLILTADRPPELQDCGAGQTIDQQHIFGGAVRSFVQAPLAEATNAAFAHARTLACRALAMASAPRPGPVHVNLPFRDPLDPSPRPADLERLSALDPAVLLGRAEGPKSRRAPWIRIEPAGPPPLAPPARERLRSWIAEEPRGFIVVGPLEDEEASATSLAALAEAAGWPLLADPLSGLRSGGSGGRMLVEAHDALLRSHAFADAHAPRRVLRFGAMPTSKAYRLFLERHPEIDQCVVAASAWPEPTHLAEQLIRAAATSVSEALVPGLEPHQTDFAPAWIRAGACVRRLHETELAGCENLTEPGVVRALARVISGPATLFVSSSMPIRDVDSFWPAHVPEHRPWLRIHSNRGANGIDGTLATALGTARAVPPEHAVVALMGDLALLHDAGSLREARAFERSLVVVVIDNDGGGIFEFLPIAASARSELFERYFTAPHRTDLEEIVRGFGISCVSVHSPAELERTLRACLGRPGVHVIRAPTDRRHNREFHDKLHAASQVALADLERA